MVTAAASATWRQTAEDAIPEAATRSVAALFLLGFARLVAGLSPVAFSNALNGMSRRRLEVTTSLALCLTGGVLLASTVLRTLPKVRESFAYLEWKLSFPVAELLFCSGLFVAYAIEEFVELATRPAGARSAEAELRINGKVAPVTENPGLRSGRGDGNTRHALVLSALTLHSILEVLFCIGLDLVSEGVSDYHIAVFMALLAVSSPVGGAAGLASAADEKVHASAVAALQGLSAGAILFVAFFEVLEKEKRKGGFIRLLCVVLGFILATGLQALEGNSNHSHLSQRFQYQTRNLSEAAKQR